MRELNGAWEVLRNPARRAEYDRVLRGETPVWERGGARPKRTATVTARVADLEPDRPGAAPAAGSGLRVGPIVFVVVVVIGLLAFAAWATTSSNDADPGIEVETGSPYEVGECVVLAAVDGRITPVNSSCTTTGALVVADITDLGRPCSTGSEDFDVQAHEVRLCLRPA